MLVELSMVEQRYQAVREVLDSGATISEVAKHYGVDRRILHRWLTRYATGGLEALVTQWNRPDTCPHQMDPAERPGATGPRLARSVEGHRRSDVSGILPTRAPARN
jgi:transposase-like protein